MRYHPWRRRTNATNNSFWLIQYASIGIFGYLLGMIQQSPNVIQLAAETLYNARTLGEETEDTENRTGFDLTSVRFFGCLSFVYRWIYATKRTALGRSNTNPTFSTPLPSLPSLCVRMKMLLSSHVLYSY